MIDYKGALKAGGNNLSDADRQIMKSLFTNDILLNFNENLIEFFEWLDTDNIKFALSSQPFFTLPFS